MKTALRSLALLILYICSIPQSHAQLPRKLTARVDSMMNAGLARGYYPGASVAFGSSAGIQFEKQYGWTDPAKSRKVETDDLYDLASLTKVVSTTFAVMRLYDQGRITIRDRVEDFLEQYDGTPVASITVEELLTHTSGLPYFPAYSLLFSNETGDALVSRKYNKTTYPRHVDRNTYLCASPVADTNYVSRTYREGYRRAGEDLYINPAVDTMVESKIKATYNPDLRGRYRYSDTNFYILRQIVESITGETLDVFTAGLFAECAMFDTGYNPLDWKQNGKIVPTELDYLMQRGQICGYVHDDLAAINGNVEGNAGLFSTSYDLSRFCMMLLGHGRLDGERILSSRTVRVFTDSPLRKNGIHRGLGFDKRGADSPLYDGFGHTGYTGTMIWMDPDLDFFMVFLSNRVNPSRLNTGLITSELRLKLWEMLTDYKKNN